MEVGNEMEIFIALTKYYTCLQRKEGNPQLVVPYLITKFHTPLTIVSNVFMRNGTYPLMFLGRVNNNIILAIQSKCQNKCNIVLISILPEEVICYRNQGCCLI